MGVSHHQVQRQHRVMRGSASVLISLALLGLSSGFPQLGNYNGPQSASSVGSDYGAAAAPACRTEYKQECSTTTERECTTVNEQQCRTVQNQQCETVNEQVCNTVNEQQCNTVYDTVNEQQCNTVNEQQCNTVNEE